MLSNITLLWGIFTSPALMKPRTLPCGIGPSEVRGPMQHGLWGYLGEEVIPYKKVEEGTWGPARWQSKSLHAYQTIEVTSHNITTQFKGHHPGDAVGLVATAGMLNSTPTTKSIRPRIKDFTYGFLEVFHARDMRFLLFIMPYYNPFTIG